MNARDVLYIVGVATISAPWAAGCDAKITKSPDPTWPSSSLTTLPTALQPPPISGGTLAVLHDGHTVVASDPDHDTLWFVDLASRRIVGNAAFQAGDEPGRIVEDADGRVHVALRRGGALATVFPSGGVIERRPVCAAPRGLAYDPVADVVHVACADGLLATFPAGGGPATRAVHVDGDLRDPVVQGTALYVSRFRSAELLRLGADGTIAERITMPSAPTMDENGTVAHAVPSVAYRTVALPGGGVAMLHQRALDAEVDTKPGGYAGGMCPGGGVVQDAVTVVQPGSTPTVAPTLMMTSVAVDLAVSPDGTQIGVASASLDGGSGVRTYSLSSVTAPAGVPPPAPPGPGVPTPVPGGDCEPPGASPLAPGQVVAVAFDAAGRLVAQTRDPAGISVDGELIALPSVAADQGHSIFHTATKAGLACASCHPEGGDDGRVWQFVGLGPRRTQNLRGGVLARAPFHWSGDLANMDALAKVVFVGRMVGPQLTEDQVKALGAWIDAQPALVAAPALDESAVARGSVLFHDATIGCATCHSGPQRSNHQLVDVGTGGIFKVPSLVAVGYRAPYLHDGCAATLLDRFGPTCGGGDQHGHTQALTQGERRDLVAFLQSL
jgi:cytochrome c553